MIWGWADDQLLTDTHDGKEVEVDFAEEAAVCGFVDFEVDAVHVGEGLHGLVCIVRVLHEFALWVCESSLLL